MKILRTPDERFANLPGYAFAPHYLEIDGIRVHYVDEGGARNGTVMLMHGEPSWSFLYRKMIPAFVAAGIRAIAPDLVGFGRSDKPADRDYYTYQRHVDWMAAWLRRLDLRDLTLVCQDWGGLIGLRLVADHSERFSRIVAANTGLPTGDGLISEAFKAWQKFSRETPQFPVGQIVAGGCARPLAPEIIAAYDAPFPDDSYKAGARQFPLLVPTSPDDPAAPANRRAWEVLRRWKRPFLTAFSDSDPITHGGEAILQAQIPGAQGQPHTTITGGGHFLQEDQGEEFARVVIDFIRSTNRQGDFQ
ncbi:MAG: haloalkane dehalogenase [Candidatus Binataceae bacterium]